MYGQYHTNDTESHLVILTDKMESEKTEKSQRKSKRTRNRILKVVRRTHMYTGLLLLPWVILFGISGVLFNHPEWFGPLDVVSKFSNRDLKEDYSLVLPDAEKIADAVVAKINGDGGSGRFVRTGGGAVIEGAIAFQANGSSGAATATISPNGHGASVKRIKSTGDDDESKPGFHGSRIEVAEYDAKAYESVAKALLEEAGVDSVASIEPNRRGGAEVRFQIESPDDGQKWNVVYGLVSGEVVARDANGSNGLTPYSFVTRLHKTHHYPDRKSARWFWTLIADCTGFTMVFWGISGAMMWWQIKPSRVIGIGGLALAAVIAGIVFTGTISNHTFGPPQKRGGQPSAKGSDGPGKGKGKGRPAESSPLNPVLSRGR